MPKTDHNGYIMESITIDGKLYVRRWIKCRKPKCWCSKGQPHPKTGAAGHGPYWYLQIVRNGQPIQRYIGKELLTNAPHRRRKKTEAHA